jgi:thiol-disulfide isomerase/thioredoxin
MEFIVRYLNILPAACLVVATVLCLAFPITASAIVRKGDPAPSLKVISTTGQKITLDNYKGYVLVVDFFTTWCVPCRESIPHLVNLNRRYGGQGLQILGMSADDDGEKVVKAFIADKKINYPVAIVGEDLTTDYGIRSIPTMFVINKKGVIAEKYQGFNDDMKLSMETLIKKLLAE